MNVLFENETLAWRIVSTSIIFIVLIIIKKIAKRRFQYLYQKYNYQPHRIILTNRLLLFTLFAGFFITIVVIWGVNINNVWVSVSGFLGLIAVAFFATWSLLSNLIAGLVIFIDNPFKIGDQIIIYEKEIEGKVIDIGPMYTIMLNKGAKTMVPNALFFTLIYGVKHNKATKSNADEKKNILS